VNRCFAVTSPEYVTYHGSEYPPLEPPEYGCEFLWVFTRTGRRARCLAVRAWRRQRRLRYCDDGNDNPFTGLKVETFDER